MPQLITAEWAKALTDNALASYLVRLSEARRYWTVEEQDALLREAASRLAAKPGSKS